MPSQIQLRNNARDAILKDVKSQEEIIKEFYDCIDKKMHSRAQLLQTRLGQVAALAVAVKKILNIFGKNFTIAGIDINQLLVGIFQLTDIKKTQTDLADAQIELMGAQAAEIAFAMSSKMRSQFGRCFGEISDAADARSRFTAFREETAEVRVQAAKTNTLLNQIAGSLNIISALSDEADKIVQLIFTWCNKIIEAVIQAIEAVVVLLQALQIAGLLANIGPFNTLPGSLTVAEAYLACILSVLGDISDAVGDLEDGIIDFRETSFKITLLFKDTIAFNALVVATGV